MGEDAPNLHWHVMLAYWFVQFAAWLALLTPIFVTMALRMAEIAEPKHKAAYLGLTLGIGAATSMVSAPIWGALSDRTRAPIGRRKLWIIIGSLSLLVGLDVMATASRPFQLGLGWIICQIGSNAAQASLNAVMSDIVPRRQQGLMSALLGMSMTAATVIGVFVTQFTTHSPSAMFLVPWLASPVALALFVRMVPDAPAKPGATAPFSIGNLLRSIGISALRHRDFAWAFASRFLVVFGAAFSMTYQVYYLTDYLHVPISRVARFMVLSISVMGTLTFFVSLIGGWFSDKIGRRKPFVGVAAIVMAVGLVGVAISRSFDQFLIASALTSVGQGFYYSVDLALCVEVLPDKASAARDLAVLQIANSLPQSLAPTVAPLLLGMAVGGLAGSNYPALFAFAALTTAVGALAITMIRGVR
jgi:MFS family permease